MRRRSGTRVFPDGTRLTARQEEVIRLLDRGLTNGEIAEHLGITLDGAKFHVTEIMNRFGVHSREEAVREWKQRPSGILGLSMAGKGMLVGASVIGTAIVIAVGVTAMASLRGDAQDSATVLAEAAEAASDGSARFTMEFTLQKPNEPPQVAQVAVGEIDFRRNRMHVSPAAGGYEQILAAGKSYQRAGPDDLWREFDAAGSNAAGSFTPVNWFDRMKSAQDVVEIGTETVHGESATVYSFTTPYPAVPGAGSTYDNTKLEFKVWLAEGRVLRIEERSEFVATGDPEMDGQSVFVQIELTGWNDPVDIEVPRPEQIER
ncbi:MAG: LuxR C-terminal-related transcriptional regulator [Dehalococcoidia bacterium]